MFKFENLSNPIKGLIYIIGGAVILLHTLNILRGTLNILLIIGSIAMIAYGVVKAGFADIIKKRIQNKK